MWTVPVHTEPATLAVAIVGLGGQVFMGETEAEAKKTAREICALPAEAVAISRKLLRPPPDEIVRRIDQETHLFSERMKSKEAVSAFMRFFQRKKG